MGVWFSKLKRSHRMRNPGGLIYGGEYVYLPIERV